MNVPASPQLTEAGPGAARDSVPPEATSDNAFGEALGEALEPAPPGAARRRGTAHRKSAPHEPQAHGPQENARQENAPAPDVGALVAAGAQAAGEPHAKAPGGPKEPRAPGEEERAGVGPVTSPAHRHAGGAAQGVVTQGVVRLRPEGAQLAAKLASRPTAKLPSSAPVTAGQGPSPLAERERQKEKPRARETIGAEIAGAPARPEPSVLLPSAEVRPPRAATAPAAAPRASSPLPPAPGGQDVAGAVLRSAAHLKVETGALGALELHLRVRDGALHLRVSGDAAHLVEARSGELSRALASDGLRLARVELPPGDGTATQAGSGGQREQRQQAWDEAAEARRSASPRSAARVAASTIPGGLAQPGDNRIDVKA